jgi:hypothetical protein
MGRVLFGGATQLSGPMFGTLFKRQNTPKRNLHPDDVRRMVRQFVDEWPPFRDRWGQMGQISVEWVKDPSGGGTWVSGIIPAIDIGCTVVVDDEGGHVIEAKIVAMRTKATLAHWHR